MRKCIAITIVIPVASYIVSIFLSSNLIGDVHEVPSQELALFCESMLRMMDDGLVEH